MTIFGDGKSDPVSIAGDKLAKKDTLRTIAGEQSFPDAIKSSREHLGKKLFEYVLQEIHCLNMYCIEVKLNA